jgi:hypothetical protein
MEEAVMKKFICLSAALLFTVISYAQPKDIWVNWECNMEIEILSGRFNLADTVAARGDFNGWMRHDLIPDPLNPNLYISEFPDLIYNAEVGDTIVWYKFFYTPNVWETGADRFYILTQDDYNTGAATISRPFNDASLSTVTNQETIIQFTVDCDSAHSFINGLPFPVINTCHIAGGTFPLQWPGSGWPNSDIGLMVPMFDDGINGGDPTAGDKIFNALVTFPAFTPFEIQYKYGINYGDGANNGGGNDNEAGIGDNHIIELEQLLESAQVLNVFGEMGLHDLINKVYIPVELSSFTGSILSGVVTLKWETATELNNLGFEIERKIHNEKLEGEWTTIAFKEGHGTSTEPQYYSFNDDVGSLRALSFTYRLKQVDYDGSFEYSKEVTVENSTVPDKYSLSQNYPNPFNPRTTIEFALLQKEFVTITIYDVLGNEVTTLIKEELSAGLHKLEFNANSLTSGVYIYKINAGTFIQTRKMTLMK